MTRSMTRSDLEEIDAFYEEFSGLNPVLTDASIDTLIDQLEASIETVETLTTPSVPSDDLRDRVQSLAQKLESFAVELGQINQQLNEER